MIAGHSIKTIESVLDLAVWLERHGQLFYSSAQESAADPELKALFSYLAEEEARHCHQYTKLYEQQLGKTSGDETLLGEYAHFIDLLIREITDNLIIEEMTTPKVLIWKALRFEKDTLLYFNEIKKLFTDDNAMLIESICKEEKSHIQHLMERGTAMQLFLSD